ncbi:MAG: family 43 glycosylhydrolase, partial [Oscillospiraceae bacterium]|nr:family 43 glycosylhydrolase [Oscillospiraceae bacterium]
MKSKKITSAAVSAVMLASLISGTTVSAAGTRVSVHDPSIVKDSKTGTYYVFGSHIDAAKTNDLQNWKLFTNGYKTPNNVEFGNLSQNLKKAFAWAGEDLGDCAGGFAVWAPDVVWNPDYINQDGSRGAYLMYFCTSSTWNTSVIGFASSKNIEGPYTFVDTLIYSGFTENDSYAKSATKNVNRKYTSTNIDELISAGQVTFSSSWFDKGAYNYRVCPNAIDPTIYYDTSGKMYMTYGSWSGGIFTLEIDKSTGRCIHPKSGQTPDGRMVDSYFGTKLIGGYHKSGEGPFIEYNPDTGYYYLWVTYGGLLSEGGYNMRVFRSESPTGPFKDAAGKTSIQTASSNLDSTGLKVMGNYKFSTNDRAYMACGHNSVLRDDDGKWYLFYHARFNDNSEYHEVRVHSMQFNADGWPVVAPNEYSGDPIHEGGYEAADIAGTYEFINHGNDTGSKIYSSSNITLSADGNISGALKGSWYEIPGTNDAVITFYGGQRYTGKFLAAKDEKGKTVMSFTAVGPNNQTVWGNKTTAFTGKPRSASAPDKFEDGAAFRIKNVNSGLYLSLEGGSAKSGANVCQSETADTWKLFDAGNNCYYISAAGADDKSLVLDCSGQKADNGTNICLYTFKGADNQKYFLSRNADGSFKIRTKISSLGSCLEVESAYTNAGANIQEWEVNGANCQDWVLEPVKTEPAVTEPPV